MFGKFLERTLPDPMTLIAPAIVANVDKFEEWSTKSQNYKIRALIRKAIAREVSTVKYKFKQNRCRAFISVVFNSKKHKAE